MFHRIPVVLFFAIVSTSAAASPSSVMNPPVFGLALHGGAGVILRSEMTAEIEALHRQKLEEALNAGYSVLEKGGSALDAVVATVRILEDSPLFNAGHGAVLNSEGVCELDASIMDGRTRKAGAIAGVQHIRNPIQLARDVMDKSRHVMLVGDGAERFASTLGYELVPNTYFQTERRKLQLIRAKELDQAVLQADGGGTPAPDSGEFAFQSLDPMPERKWGTVGAVALDQAGNLAAATSTGGMTNKKFGRVGDSPIIGAGNYADNRSCAVSATGHGEYFIRATVAHSVSARMLYGGAALPEAAKAAVAEVGELGGTGGLVAMDRNGQVAMPFNTPGMYRACRVSTGRREVSIFAP